MVQSPSLLSLELHDEGQNTCQCHGQGFGGRHISYLHQILQVIDLGLVLGLRVLVSPLLLFYQTLDSQEYITHEIPS